MHMTDCMGTVVDAFGCLIACVVFGVLSYFFMRALPVTIGAGAVAVFSLVRLFRGLCEAGTRHFALWFSLGIILTLAALSPVAMLGFRMIQYAVWSHWHG
jgi:hypothetical protein